MKKISSFGAGFVYKGDPKVISTFLTDLEKICAEKGIKMKYERIIEIEV